MTSSADVARVLLAGIRLTMGSAGLLAPGLVIRRLDIDPATQPGMRCPLRVFGIRTVLIGAELLTPDTRRRGHAEQLAPVVHGSDTVSAFPAWRRGDGHRHLGGGPRALAGEPGRATPPPAPPAVAVPLTRPPGSGETQEAHVEAQVRDAFVARFAVGRRDVGQVPLARPRPADHRRPATTVVRS